MPKKPGKNAAPATLPSRAELKKFIASQTGRVGKREIAKHFKLGTEQRPAIRALLKELSNDGAIQPAGKKRFSEPGALPEVMVIQVTGTDNNGDPIARPVAWEGTGKPPVIFMHPEARGQAALAPGQRVLARLKKISGEKYEGRTIKRLAESRGKILGVFRAPNRIVPTDRRAKAEWQVAPDDVMDAETGEIVLAEPLPGHIYGLKPARITERLGKFGDARSVSLICIHTHDIPHEFEADSLAEAARARAVPLGKRRDLRETPLITIDGSDARDFDDAVYAEPDGDGFTLIVAIADVSHYVRAGSALDREAQRRGNSVYFPDRVVPMLPEKLSNGWCSLKPGEDRGCLFVTMRIDKNGKKISHAFGRGLMRSAARTTYEEIEAAHETGNNLNLPEGFIACLYAAYRALLSAREARGTLDLDLPERRVILTEDGKVDAIVPRARLHSHRLIEEFMVLANVAAAEELERLTKPCMYRVHAPPTPEKLFNLRAFLRTLDISLPPGNMVHPRDLDHVLQQAAGSEHAPLVNEVMLRSQSQAAYDPENIGHFGLSLPRYAHFTSPIRRYADLLVHRALILGLKLGAGGLSDAEVANFPDIATHISATERRAALAERDAVDRYLSAYMADKIGVRFAARISGVTRFGLFVTLDGSGASGLIPLAALPDDYWNHDEATQSLTGRRTRIVFRLGTALVVALRMASPITGGLQFDLAEEARPGKKKR
jgi:ribonuclease R